MEQKVELLTLENERCHESKAPEKRENIKPVFRKNGTRYTIDKQVEQIGRSIFLNKNIKPHERPVEISSEVDDSGSAGSQKRLLAPPTTLGMFYHLLPTYEKYLKLSSL